jgi:catechol 2,3-dioxygenase-like lactoylglutathione lyase family enzyme
MSSTTAPATLQTGHVGLNVTDLSRSLDFYRRVFGFEVMGDSHDGERSFAFLGRSGKLLVTLWQQSKGDFSAAAPGLHHLSFQVDSIDDVRAAEAALRELSATFVYDGVVPHAEGAASGGIFFTDPDGIRLEIYAPTGAAGTTAPSGAAPTCGFF